MVKKQRRIQDLVGLVHSLYPPELAEEWDNVGLQVGNPDAPLGRVVVALDPCLDALAFAQKVGAQALLTHHPLIFGPLKRLTPEDAVGEIICSAVQSKVAIVSAHTNLDSAVNGLNCWLAATLDLVQVVPLQPAAGNYLKLVVYVPAGHEESVAAALFAAGAGKIGKYDGCSFRSSGTGTFRPGHGATPFVGQVGRAEEVSEVRLETIIPSGRLNRVLEKMLKVHPYEEVAYDLLPLRNHVPDAGMGRIGRLEQKLSVEAFLALVKEQLKCEQLRVCGELDRPVGKVAVCGGSGSGLLKAARRQGADVLVTGDVKYHEARQAEELGMLLVDAGHFATERLAITELSAVLGQATQACGWDLVVEEYTGEKDPFRVF